MQFWLDVPGSTMKHVLVVANDAAIRTLAAIFLEHLGYRVDLAADFRSGIGAVRISRPDIILLVSHPGRLPASTFLDAYAAVCDGGGHQQPSPVAVLAAELTEDIVACPLVRGSLRMPFSLEELERLVWSLAHTSDELSHWQGTGVMS